MGCFQNSATHCKCGFAQNREIAEVKDGDACPSCKTGKVVETKSIEVGNIFPLKTRFTDAFGFKVQGPDRQMHDVLMGCYGIGPSRVMGSIVEIHNDDRGMIWPKSVAPFDVHIVSLSNKDQSIKEKIENTAESLMQDLEIKGVEVLWDDRDASAGEKFADADLIGIPLRLVVSEKSLAEDSVEWKERHEETAQLVKLTDLVEEVIALTKNGA
ncbi:hypothetical protein HYV69_00380 [Candidatus Uhrbacteria bacterium]|nr:hypothetical protein [Candidatus Uhrbacteria bacterium]